MKSPIFAILFVLSALVNVFQRDKIVDLQKRQCYARPAVLTETKQDVAKTCVAWWTGDTNLVKVRHKLCGR